MAALADPTPGTFLFYAQAAAKYLIHLAGHLVQLECRVRTGRLRSSSGPPRSGCSPRTFAAPTVRGRGFLPADGSRGRRTLHEGRETQRLPPFGLHIWSKPKQALQPDAGPACFGHFRGLTG